MRSWGQDNCCFFFIIFYFIFFFVFLSLFFFHSQCCDLYPPDPGTHVQNICRMMYTQYTGDNNFYECGYRNTCFFFFVFSFCFFYFIFFYFFYTCFLGNWTFHLAFSSYKTNDFCVFMFTCIFVCVYVWRDQCLSCLFYFIIVIIIFLIKNQILNKSRLLDTWGNYFPVNCDRILMGVRKCQEISWQIDLQRERNILKNFSIKLVYIFF